MATNLVRFDMSGNPGQAGRWGVVSEAGVSPLAGDYPSTAALIERGHDVTVARQVFAQNGRRPPIAAARVRVKDERPWIARRRRRPDVDGKHAVARLVLRFERLVLNPLPAHETDCRRPSG